MMFSVVICTHNRANMLKLALESLDRQTLDSQDFEVLVVDNGSTDSTAEIVQPWLATGQVKYFCEGIPGLSRARNLGWQKAEGEWVVYLDDDAVASPRWLESYFEAIEELPVSVGCVGGPIRLIWPAPEPDWLPRKLCGALGELNWGGDSKVLKSSEWIGGGNSSFRRDVLEFLEGFSEELGRKGSRLLSCEESHLRSEIEKAGYLCGYAPNAYIWHNVEPRRMTRFWFLKRGFWQGVSLAKMYQINSGSNFLNLFTNVFFTFASFFKKFFILIFLNWFNKKKKFEEIYNISETVGRLCFYFRSL